MPASTDILSSALTQLRAEQLHIPSGACASHAVADGTVAGSVGLTGLAGSDSATSAGLCSPICRPPPPRGPGVWGRSSLTPTDGAPGPSRFRGRRACT